VSRFGNIISIDLSSESIRQEAVSEAAVLKHLGGLGHNVAALYRHSDARIDPFDPHNLLVIGRGLLTGTVVPSSARVHINTISPQSGLLGSSNVGGYLGVRMYALDIFSIRIKGKASRPVYLYAGPDKVEIRDAEPLWGLDTRAAEERLRKQVGSQHADTLVIGPAGEKGALYACIMAGWDHAAGRTGLGAVMGAKHLKAIVLKAEPNKEKMTADQADVIREYVGRMKKSVSRYRKFSKWGSAYDIMETHNVGTLGTRNYQDAQLDNVQMIDGHHLVRYVKKKSKCHRCPIGCKAEIELPSGKYMGFKGGRPEYETVIDLGALCGLTNPEDLLYLSNLCNIVGLDTISTGSVIAFAMELYQRGILSLEDTHGIELTWGNAAAMEAVIRQIADRQGLGDILARGVKQAADVIGRGASTYAYHVKGVELYGGDPRGMMGMALAYAVSMRGGDFTSVYPVPEFRYSPQQADAEFGTRSVTDPAATEGKGVMVKKCMTVSTIIDSLGICKVPALSIIGDFSLEMEARLIAATTGLVMSPEDLFEAGERIINLEKIINIRQGSIPEDDNLPDFFLNTAFEKGPIKGRTVNLAPMVADFYAAMGWDEKGRPTENTLQRFGLKI
jgi:aldehyde:ferredoxin oxidoreductase